MPVWSDANPLAVRLSLIVTALLAAFDAVKRTRATAQKRLAETAMAPSN